MWLKFVLFHLLYINVFTFGQVVSLKKGSIIRCATTQYNSAIYLDPPDQNVTLVSKSRYLTYIDPELHKTGWILRNTTELIIDKRWEDFKLIKKNNVSFWHFSSPIAFSVYSFNAINMVLYEKRNKMIKKQLIMKNISYFKRWHHIVIRLENKNLTIFEETTRLKTIPLYNRNLYKLQLSNGKRQDLYWKIHKYSHYFSETVSQANEKPPNFNFFSAKDKEKICVKIFVKLKKNCILLMKLNEEIISNVTSSHEQWQLRSWSLLTKKGYNAITFYKNANSNITNKFWAFQIHSISPHPCQNYEIYEAKSHNNETCRTLSTAGKKPFNNIFQPGILGDGLTCENILGDKLETCQRHKIYFEASNQYRCAWGYEPPNCEKECDNGTYGIDCMEKCEHCQICNHINGSCFAQENSKKLDVNLNFIQADDKFVLSWTDPSLSSSELTVYNVEIYGFNFNQTYNTSETKYHIGLRKDIYNIYNITVKAMDGLIGEIRARILPSVLEQSKPSIEICRNSSCNLSIANAAGNYILYDLNCTIKFEPTNVVSLVADSNLTIKYKDRFYCLESNSQNEDYEKSNVHVFVVTAVLLITVILFAAYFIFAYKFSKFPFDVKVPSRQNRFQKTDIGEVKLIMKENDESKAIKVAHLENYLLDSIEGDIGDNELARQFQRVPKVFNDMPTEAGMMAKNKRKNRYNDLLPYDKNRVVLQNNGDNGDYINASYIDGYKASKAFIATQAPKFKTIPHFWLMICEQRVSMILMLTQLIENGFAKAKQYWPNEGLSAKYGEVTVQNVETQIYPDYIERTLQVTYNNYSRTVKHLQLVSWPYYQVPLFPQSLLPVMKRLLAGRQDTPIVVHCSSGCGRTGTIILCDIAARMAKRENKIDFVKILCNIRKQRVMMVNSADQFIFAHLLVLEYLRGKNFAIPVTENFQKDIENAQVESNIKEVIEILEKVNNIFNKTQITNDLYLANRETLRNRFIDILPCYKRSSLMPHKGSNYINAISVDCYKSKNKFIVTQQPLNNTVEDFWRLIMEQDVNTIISLNEIDEGDQSHPQFWPHSGETRFINMTFHAVEKHDFDRYEINKIRAQIPKNKEKLLNLICLRNWLRQTPLPQNEEDLVSIWQEIFSNSWKDNKPIVITCYDGCTASGLFASLAFLLEKLNLEQICDIFSAVRTIKQRQIEFMKDPVQLEFLYKAAALYVEQETKETNLNEY